MSEHIITKFTDATFYIPTEKLERFKELTEEISKTTSWSLEQCRLWVMFYKEFDQYYIVVQ